MLTTNCQCVSLVESKVFGNLRTTVVSGGALHTKFTVVSLHLYV